jgi:hypothetical protein
MAPLRSLRIVARARRAIIPTRAIKRDGDEQMTTQGTKLEDIHVDYTQEKLWQICEIETNERDPEKLAALCRANNIEPFYVYEARSM